MINYIVRALLALSVMLGALVMEASNNNPLVHVTIWIHGTRGISFLPLGFSKKVLETEQRMCYCPEGLRHASSIDQSLHHGNVAYILSQADAHQFPFEHFYTFGWSGYANPTARKQAGFRLYKEIIELKKNYLKIGMVPTFTIITHSHGGNVALNIARFALDEDAHLIERLIVLGCPVQKETASFAQHPVFARVYSFFSSADLLQVVDPQKLYPWRFGIKDAFKTRSLEPLKKAYHESRRIPFFSKRLFPTGHKIHQVCVAWQHNAPWQDDDFRCFGHHENIIRKLIKQTQKPRGLLHIEFMMPLFFKRLSHLLTCAHELNHQKIADASFVPPFIHIKL